jgi:hypothetical protein
MPGAKAVDKGMADIRAYIFGINIPPQGHIVIKLVACVGIDAYSKAIFKAAKAVRCSSSIKEPR